MTAAKGLSRSALLLALFSLPLVLVVSSLLSFRELDQMKGVYLRNRAAALAARLETLTPEQIRDGAFEVLAEEEPSLADLVVFGAEDAGPGEPGLEAIRSGRELFRTEELAAAGTRLFRAYIPFHSESRMLIARLDLDAAAADFLAVHARHNLLVSTASGIALILLSAYFVWSSRRASMLERRRLELEHLAHLGKMSAVLAHEIRNPLGTIKGFAQLALEKADRPLGTLLEPVLGEIHRLEKLVNDLLMYGRPRDPAPHATDWAEIASHVEVHARQAIGSRPIRFTVDGGQYRFETDPDLLKAALLNLVRNSVEAIPEGQSGEVRLAIAAGQGGSLAISVEDDGPGIPDAMRGRLFEPFLTTKPFGTGLGLSIASKLAESLGGRLELKPRAPRGARAELIFPRAGAEPIGGRG